MLIYAYLISVEHMRYVNNQQVKYQASMHIFDEWLKYHAN